MKKIQKSRDFRWAGEQKAPGSERVWGSVQSMAGSVWLRVSNWGLVGSDLGSSQPPMESQELHGHRGGGRCPSQDESSQTA